MLDNEDLADAIEDLASGLDDWLKDDTQDQGQTAEGNDPEGSGQGDMTSDDFEQGEDGGKGTTLREQFIHTCKARLESAQRLRKKLNEKRELSPQARIQQAIEDLAQNNRRRSVVPYFHDRRASAKFSSGVMPLFYRKKKTGAKMVVPCYVDVSGSQTHVLPTVLPVVARLRETIGDEVYCFSNHIFDCPVLKLSQGYIKTSGGTDFDIIADHIIKNNFKSALILTDGQACLSDENIQKLRNRNIRIKVGWTVPNPDVHPLKYVSREMFYVFGE
jgi:hypothetical protein